VNPDILVAGILAGGLYALIGLGISLIFGVLGMMNLAHGEFVVGGAFVASLLVTGAGWDPLLTLPLAMVGVALVAYPLQRYLLTDLQHASKTAPLVATFGISLLAQAALQAIFGIDPKTLRAPYANAGLSILGLRIQAIYLIAFGITVILCVAAHLLLTRTRAGSAVRASSADPVTAAVMGINVQRVYALTFAGAAALAAAGGVITGIAQSFSPTSGLPLLLIGFAVMAMGGIGSVGGVLAGGIALGLLQSLTVSLFGGGWRNFVVYVVFFLALAFRPNGVFRRAVRA
jgi:branched-chain amino acid transport system permease protein